MGKGRHDLRCLVDSGGTEAYAWPQVLLGLAE